MRRFAVAAVIVSFLVPAVALAAVHAPVKKANIADYVPADGEFSSAIVIDVKSKKVLYEYHADTSWPAASLTKLMGALVFMDYRPSWTRIIAMNSKDEVGGGRLRVNVGAKLSVRDLLYSSITASANNAAMALARITGLPTSMFVKKMNAKAKTLGLAHSAFVDPSGMDTGNVTTARDMATLASTAFNQPDIRRAASTGLYSFTIRNTGQLKQLKNTDHLLTSNEFDDVYVTGGKTGFLYESMHNLAVRMRPMEDLNDQRTLMVVVFGSQTDQASFVSGDALAKWAWNAYTW